MDIIQELSGVNDAALGIKPIYRELAQIAYDTVLQMMVEGEQAHGVDEWKDVKISGHMFHAAEHCDNALCGDKSEDHIAHALTRCAMIKYLEQKR